MPGFEIKPNLFFFWEKLLYINWVGHLLLKVHPPNYLEQESSGIAQEEVPRKELDRQMKVGRH